MNTLEHIPKHILQQAIINCIEAVYTTFIQKKAYVYKTYLNEYEMFKPTQSRQYPQSRCNTHDINNQQKKKITQPFKLNQFEPIILTNRVYHSKPKQIAYDHETYHGYEIYQPTQINLQTQTVKLKHDNNHIQHPRNKINQTQTPKHNKHEPNPYPKLQISQIKTTPHRFKKIKLKT